MIGRLAAHMRAIEEGSKQRRAQLTYELAERGLKPLRIPRLPLALLAVMIGLVWVIGFVTGGLA